MRRILAFSAILLTFCLHTWATDWVDVTDAYITNPYYDYNSNEGWTISASAGSTNCDYGAQEFWNGTWNIYQTLQLTDGHYRLSVQGFHRYGDLTSANSTQAITSYLYANDTEQAMVSIYSESLSYTFTGCTTYDGKSGQYYPNTMESASYCFGLDMYWNEMEFDVTTGEVTIGIKNSVPVSSNWCIFDNWKLEYYGDIVSVSDIALSSTSSSLALGEELQLTYILSPSDATFQTLNWSSSDESVATVSSTGLVTTEGVGTATITATAIDGCGTTAACTVTVANNTAALSDLIITEIQSANIDQYLDPSWNYGAWVELYNPTSTSVTLTGCWVSDDVSNLEQVHITEPMAVPAGGYKNLWFDHYDKYSPKQVNMKLDQEGGTIYITSDEGVVIAQADYPEAVARCSWARTSLDGDTWSWTSTPTPEAANDGSTWCTERLSAPVVDLDSQIFGTQLTVCVSIPEGATLRYTTDGSAPTATNGETSLTGLFYPSETTTYRFCLIEDGKMPSPVIARTYIYKDKDFDLPVLSIVSANDNFYSDDYGIFTQGNGNGRAGNGQSSACNWNMDWERPGNFEFINEEGEMSVNQETAIERCGGWSRAWTPYSFKVKANKQYELQNYLPYQFFPEKPYLKHKALQIRNGGNDNWCRIKDPALQEIVFRSGIDVNTQSYVPVMHYINGKYAGTINMREPNNKHYVYANYGLDDDEIDQFEMSPDSGYIQKCGTKESFELWYDLSESCSDATVYEQIKEIVDIDEYCNYMAIEFYLGSTDWPQNNIKGWKPIMDGGKFRFILFDLDGALATTSSFTTFANKQTYTFDLLYGEDVDHWTKEIEMVTIFLNMLQNDDFRKQFIDSYCLVAGSVFEPTRCEEIINELSNAVSTTQSVYNEVYNSSGATPWSTANSLISSLSSSRQSTMISTLKSYSKMELTNTTAQSVTLSANIDEARLTVNDLPVPTNKFDGQLFPPITFRSQAPAGYRFEGWKLVSGTTTTGTSIVDKGNTWQYYDGGSLDDEDWTSADYDRSSWNSGASPIGYGKTDIVTTTTGYLSTYYFATTATLTDALDSDEEVTLSYVADDGFILYVNGTEAARYNMPTGTVTYSTYASTYAPNNPDSGTLTLSSSLFKSGENVIAVEVHNNSTTSSDIYWDAAISYSSNETEGDIACEDEEYEMPTSSTSMVLQACYTEMTDEEKAEAGLSTAPVVINEVSAANSINVNEYFKKDDWVELYNTTDEDIDLEGMYMTDNSEKPQKWQITATGTNASTIIEAHGYKIIWCSKRDTDQELHASFKLDNEDGAMVRIQAEDGSWADSLFYCTMNGDQTVGRYPDGGEDVYLMTTTTIAASNTMTTYATEWVYEAPETDDTEGEGEGEGGENAILTARSGGMSIACQSGWLSIKSEDDDRITLQVVAASGVVVMQQTLDMESHHARVNVSQLPAGVYIASVTDSDGETCATKFVKKQ